MLMPLRGGVGNEEESRRTGRLASWAPALGIPFLFVVDCMTPLGVGVWAMYGLPVLWSLRFGERRGAVAVAATCSVLLYLSLFFAPAGSPIERVLFNRTLGVALIWVATFFNFRLRAAESKLRETDSLYRQLLTYSPAAILVCREDRILSANQNGAKLFLLDEKEIVGESILDLFPRESREVLQGLLASNLASQEVEISVATKEGSTRILEATMSPCFDLQTATCHLIIRDVTERRNDEAALRRNEQMLRGLIAHLPLGAVHQDGGRLVLNRAAEEITGLSSGGNVQPLIDWIGALEKGDASRRGNGVESHWAAPRTGWWIRGDGSRRFVELSSFGEESPQCWLLRDLTICDHLDRLMEQAAQTARVGGWEFDCITKALYWTEETYRLQGTSPQEHTPTIETAGTFFTAESKALLLEAHRRAVHDGEPFDLELELSHPSRRNAWVRVQGHAEREDGWTRRVHGVIQDVSEQKRVQEQARRLASILEASPDHVSVIAPDGGVLYLNRAAREIRGLDYEQLLEKSFEQLHPRWAFQRIQSMGRPAAVRNGVWAGETALLTAEGRELPVSQMIVAHKDSSGRVEYYSSVMRDLTDRKHAEEALRSAHKDLADSKQLLQAIIDTVPCVITAKDAHGRFLVMNQFQAHLYGVTPDYAVGKKIDELASTDRAADEEQRDRDVIERGRSIAYSEVTSDSVGTPRYWWTVKAPLARLDSARGVSAAGVVSVSVDVAEQRAARETIEQRDRFIRNIAEATPDVLYVYDLTQGRIDYVNRQFTEYLGFPKDSLIDGVVDPLQQLIHPDDQAKLPELFGRWNTARDEDTLVADYRLRHASGDWRWFRSRDRVFERSSDGRVQKIIGVASDVTDQRAIHRRTDDQRQELQEILDAVQAQVWRMDLQGRAVWRNRFAERATGLAREQIVGCTVMTLAPQWDDPPLRHEQTLEVARTGVARLGSIESCLIGNEIHWFSVDKSPTYNAAGEIVGVLIFLYDVTPIKRIEEALRRSEARSRNLATIAARTDNAVILTDFQTRIEWVNEGFTRMTGYVLDEVKGLVPGEVLQGPDSDPATIEYMRRRLREKEGFAVEIVNYDKHGRRYWASVEVQPIHDDAGAVTHYMAIESDVTERKEVIAALEERAGLAALTALVGVALTQSEDFQGMLQRCADAVSARLGADFARIWTIDESNQTLRIQAGAGKCDDPDGPGDLIAVGETAIGKIAQTKVAITTNSDAEDWEALDQGWFQREKIHSFAGYPLVVGERVLGVLGVYFRGIVSEAAHDAMATLSDAIALGIERKRAETSLRESEERFRQLAENSNEVIWVKDWSSSRILYTNPAYETVWGRSREDLYADSNDWIAAIHPEDRPRVEAAFLQESEGGCFSEEYRIYRSDGSMRWIWDRAFPIRDPAGRLYRMAGIANDVTAWKLAQAELNEAKEAAESANRAKSEFLSRVSHELRTPLNAVLGFAQLLQMDALSTQQSDDVEQILRGGHLLLGLINEVLDISRIESGRIDLTPEPVAVARLLHEAVELVRPLAYQRSIQLQLCLGAGENKYVVGDRQRIHQVLLNLLSNAVKYNHVGGQVVVACEAWRKGRMRITVRDSGPGISTEKMDRLFTPFDRLGAETTRIEGVGLGLVLSKRLIEAMGGDLGVEIQADSGASFYIELNEACIDGKPA